MSNHRADKIRMWNKNPNCHWCNIPTQLTNCSDGKLADNAATVDHLFSKLNPARWVKRKPGEVKKVLACYGCNQLRSIEENDRLSREEIFKRSQGFSLNPSGKPHIINTLDTVEEVVSFLKEQGVDISAKGDIMTV
jgi:hypothetical protein